MSELNDWTQEELNQLIDTIEAEVYSGEGLRDVLERRLKQAYRHADVVQVKLNKTEARLEEAEGMLRALTNAANDTSVYVNGFECLVSGIAGIEEHWDNAYSLLTNQKTDKEQGDG